VCISNLIETSRCCRLSMGVGGMVALLALGLCSTAAVKAAESASAAGSSKGLPGVAVQYLEPGAPAAAAGLRLGDRVVSVDGEPVDSLDELVRRRDGTTPGQKLRLRYVRDGVRTETTLTVEGHYLPEIRPHTDGVASTKTPEPLVTPSGKRVSLQILGPKFVQLNLSGAVHPAVRLASSEFQTEEYPARAGYSREVLHRHQSSTEIRIGADVLINSASGAKVRWRERDGFTRIILGKQEGSGTVESRWHGWGLTLWDVELERFADATTTWSLRPCWGFGVPDPLRKSPPPPGPAGSAFPNERGARVLQRVSPTSPAGEAGLAVGDLIVSADDKPIGHPGDLHQLMQRSFPGQRVRLKYLRGEEPRETALTVQAPSIPPPPPAEAPKPRPVPPVISRMGQQTTLSLEARANTTIQVAPLVQRELNCSADRMRVEDRPAKLNAPRQLLYHFSGNVEVRFPSGVVIRSDQPVLVVWGEGMGAVYLTLHTGEQASRQPGPARR